MRDPSADRDEAVNTPTGKGLYHDAYPHDWEDLPSLGERILDRDWEVLLVYDACRWDAYEAMVGPADPVATDARRATPDFAAWWVEHADAFDDLTYVSGNPRTSTVRTQDGYEHVRLGRHFDYVQAFVDHERPGGRDLDPPAEVVPGSEPATAYDPFFGVARPDRLTAIAGEYDPPMVVHYVQPHTPFIGDVSLRVVGYEDRLPLDFEHDRRGMAKEYRLYEEGYVSRAFLRAAYLENLRLVHEATEPLREEYDTVVTADHGERLGPEPTEWHHGGTRANVARVVPWARFE